VPLGGQEHGRVNVIVYGAYGHTGRFVVAELVRRGHRPVLSGRDPERLKSVSAAYDGLEVRPAAVGDVGAVLGGAEVVVHCAGPFAQTAEPVLEAAARAGVHYVDIAAEVEVAAAAFERYADAGVVVAPSVGFYGGLGDLLATAALGDWPSADEVVIAYALSSWRPTAGTRATIEASRQRRSGRRIVYAGGRLSLRTDSAPVTSWTFPEPLGEQPVVAEFTTADSVTIPHHLRVSELRTYMTTAPLADLADGVPPPEAADPDGRSAQTFLVEAVVRRGAEERRAVARGRDIYAITAPLVAEALDRIPSARPGVLAPAELLDAPTVLRTLGLTQS
jgi:short subunit dehydrogenase-like uncharacterized protein